MDLQEKEAYLKDLKAQNELAEKHRKLDEEIAKERHKKLLRTSSLYRLIKGRR